MTEPTHAAPSYADNEEMSFRDLYLVLRRGMPLILSVAAIAGILAFVVSSLLPPVYQAESTTLVAPPPVRIQGGDLTFAPLVDVSFESYQTLAQSRPVLEATLKRVPGTGLSPAELLGMSELEKLLGTDRQNQSVPLSVTHRVRAKDPALAAKLADAWAVSTLETVKSSLLDNLSPANEATGAEVERLRSQLREAEQAWSDFQARDNSALLQTRLNQLNELIASAEAGYTLQGDAEAEPGTDPGGVLAGLGLSNRINLPQEIAATRAALEALPRESDRRAALAARLAGLQARSELLPQQLQNYRTTYKQVQQELAALTLERSQLERKLDEATEAYQQVIRLEPTISYITELAPTNARMLSRASVPVGPSGPRRLLNTALAVALGGMLALVFVFIREAVSEGGEAPLPAGRAMSGQPSPSKG
ncbi:MAG TPA: Wzz/FepE/Etk N-terminal domain-containing protein [Trueperaceae bacterium]